MEAGLTPPHDLIDALREAAGADAVILDDTVLAGLEPTLLASFARPVANPAARALVDTLRRGTCALFREAGGASNQIGRTYPFMEALAPNSASLLRGLKAQLDPQRRMNPGVLGL